MHPAPLYTPENVHQIAYQLRYGWTGWLRSGDLRLANLDLSSLDAAWESDGLRRLETNVENNVIQIAFSTKPHVSPALCAHRAKGRLSYACRQAGLRVEFSRKVALRSIGENRASDVQNYIVNQVSAAKFVDPRTALLLAESTRRDATVDFAIPQETHSGRYWNNLHVVLVTSDRCAEFDRDRLELIRDTSFRIAAKKVHQIGVLAIMPDHLHLALRANIEHSPFEIALAFMNNLAYTMGLREYWQHGFYAGTFGEYSMAAIRHRDEVE